jgi:TonB family protein
LDPAAHPVTVFLLCLLAAAATAVAKFTKLLNSPAAARREESSMRKTLLVALAIAVQPAPAAAAVQLADPHPATSPGSWMSIADYPAGAMARHQEGSVGFRLQVDPSGVVQSCSVTNSSGSSSLDEGTCALLKSRAKFDPARDSNGHAVAGTFASHVQWVYPQVVPAPAAEPQAVEIHGSERRGDGVSVLWVDETGRITKCDKGDSGYANIPDPQDFCRMFALGSRYAPPALYKGRPQKRKITLTLHVDDVNVR